MYVGCETELKKSVGRKKLVSDEVEANAFSRCLKRRIAVNDILCNKCRLSIYRNNSDKDSDCETDTGLSPSNRILKRKSSYHLEIDVVYIEHR